MRSPNVRERSRVLLLVNAGGLLGSSTHLEGQDIGLVILIRNNVGADVHRLEVGGTGSDGSKRGRDQAEENHDLPGGEHLGVLGWRLSVDVSRKARQDI